MTKFGKDPRPLAEIFCQVSQQALTESKIQEVDALYIGVMNPEELPATATSRRRLSTRWALPVFPLCVSKPRLPRERPPLCGFPKRIASGYYRRVLVLGGEKMTHLSTSATTRILAEVIDKRERQCGATIPALAAMVHGKVSAKISPVPLAPGKHALQRSPKKPI